MTNNPSTAPAARSSETAIVARGLSRHFDGVTAVAGLDLDVRAGEIYGFLGPNGAGKSTTVRMLCTLLAPSGGTAFVAGHDVVQRPDQVRLRIGAALQEAALDPRQTGEQLLRLQGRLYGLSRADVDGRLVQLAELVELGGALQRPISTYSGGMRRRLDLAASLIHNPRVLFLDEPTTGLDPASRNRVWEEVRRLNRELGMTILLTTQYLEEADALADRVGIIDAGRLVAEGTPDELKRAVGHEMIIARVDGDPHAVRSILEQVPGAISVDSIDGEVVISTDRASATIGPVAIALDQHAIPVLNLTMRTPTLDDVFLDLTGARIRSQAPTPTDDRLDHMEMTR